MLALRPLLVGPPPKPGLGARQEGPTTSPEHPAHGGRGLGEPQPKVASSQQGQPRAVGVLQHAGIYFFFLRRSLLSPSLSSFSRGTARGVGKKQNRCERWSPALAERRGLGSSSTAVLSGMGGTWQGWDLSWQGPAVTCAGCWVLGTMQHPGQPGWGSHGCPGCGAQLWRPPRGVTSFVPVLREELVLQKHRDL